MLLKGLAYAFPFPRTLVVDKCLLSGDAVLVAVSLLERLARAK